MDSSPPTSSQWASLAKVGVWWHRMQPSKRDAVIAANQLRRADWYDANRAMLEAAETFVTQHPFAAALLSVASASHRLGQPSSSSVAATDAVDPDAVAAEALSLVVSTCSNSSPPLRLLLLPSPPAAAVVPRWHHDRSVVMMMMRLVSNPKAAEVQAEDGEGEGVTMGHDGRRGEGKAPAPQLCGNDELRLMRRCVGLRRVTDVLSPSSISVTEESDEGTKCEAWHACVRATHRAISDVVALHQRTTVSPMATTSTPELEGMVVAARLLHRLSMAAANAIFRADAVRRFSVSSAPCANRDDVTGDGVVACPCNKPCDDAQRPISMTPQPSSFREMMGRAKDVGDDGHLRKRIAAEIASLLPAALSMHGGVSPRKAVRRRVLGHVVLRESRRSISLMKLIDDGDDDAARRSIDALKPLTAASIPPLPHPTAAHCRWLIDTDDTLAAMEVP